MPRQRLIPSSILAVLVTAALPSSVLAYEVAPVADGGTISGKVTFSGPVPTKKIIPTKDKEVCGDIREEPEIVVGADKGVLDAVVYLKSVEKGKAFQKPAQKPEIVNKGCRFVPNVQAFPVGTVVIVNSDPVMHNTHGFHDKATVFNVALPMKGQRIERPLKKPGITRVECDAHGWMLAWIYVADNPYYAVTQKDGAFSITDVPPGNYTLVAWHAFTGPTEVAVTVKPKEAAKVPVELKK
ncbi:carboxypeptidase regulatory-like domain-containing protein [Anaeromyxobacter sp. Fw109-5]|uniref:carboxypeptidase regulatory-like domain-containing protein n=1 Tax=Anaeromyxobacter sp. (strain Fw109-5) TaxID=404589 RepID=UPI0000ED8047|nr:carboxypeptidase regulatory-like domain-containing protein [Anaeromyxobacter sp. Fw109-5]ABS27053.1 putative lipoprotein [Anaeromyxobacter sp. Fw109-5]